MCKSQYVFFDVETPNCRNDRICSIAALLDTGESFASLIDPECEFHRFNISIHGITPEMTFYQPNFRAVWTDRLHSLFENKIVVGYNVTFDLRVLSKTLRAYGFVEPVWRYIDVLTAARRFFDLPRHSLSDVMEELGASFRHHDAEEDVRATKIVFDAILREAPGLFKEKIYSYAEREARPRW